MAAWWEVAVALEGVPADEERYADLFAQHGVMTCGATEDADEDGGRELLRFICRVRAADASSAARIMEGLDGDLPIWSVEDPRHFALSTGDDRGPGPCGAER